MNDTEKALIFLHDHEDPRVHEAAVLLRANFARRKRILNLVQEAIAQLRVDIKYLMFDLECTKNERDRLIEGMR